MTLRAHGLTVREPDGWDVRIFRRRPADGAATHPVLHAATVRLPWERGDYGSNVVDRLGADDCFVALLEFAAADASSPLFAAAGLPRLRAADFHPRQLHRVLPGQSGVQRFFHVGHRAFSVYVVIGAHARRLHAAPRVRELLGSVGVGSRS